MSSLKVKSATNSRYALDSNSHDSQNSHSGVNSHSNSNSAHNGVTLTMFYDDACVICSSEARNMKKRNPEGIHLVSVDDGIEILNQAGFSKEDAMTYLCVQDGMGNWYTQMEAVRRLYVVSGIHRASWLYLPLIKQLGDVVYPFIARNRYRFPHWVSKLLYGKAVVDACKEGTCQLPAHRR